MSTSLNILIVSPDRGLEAEVTAACAGWDGPQPVVRAVADARQGVEAARSMTPQLVLIEMSADLRSLEMFARDVAAGSPESTVAAAFRPYGAGANISESEILIGAIRAGVRDFLRRPVSTDELGELLLRISRTASRLPARNGRIVSFISNKGGVGKSTLAVNAACGLALRHPERVLLIDASLQMGVCASMLDLHPQATLTDAVREAGRLDETLLRQLAEPHPSGLHLLAAPATAVEAAEVTEQAISRVLTLARRCYDFVVVDTFPMIDRVMMAVLDRSHRVYIVLESVVPTLLGGVKLIELLDGLNFPQEHERVVLNRYLKLPGNLQPGEVAERLGRRVDLVIPYDKRIVIAANMGQPYIQRAGRFFGCGPKLRQLVGEIEGLARAAVPSRNGQPAPGVAPVPGSEPE